MRLLLAVVTVLCSLAGMAQEPCDVSLTGTPITCPGDDNGTLTVVAASGGPYNYTWAHDGGIVGGIATNLEPGPYSVTVTDATGCESILDTVITDPNVESLGVLTYTDITCAGANDATITLTLNPGGPYQFGWLEPANVFTNTIVGLGPGVYVVAIIPPVGCTSFLGQQIDEPGIAIEGETDYCPSDPPVLTVAPFWGFEPDVYLWSTGEVTSSIEIVPGTVGPIDVTATDTILGCVATAQLVLIELPGPTVAMAAPDTTCVNVLTLVNTVATTADSLVWRWADHGFSNELDPIINFTESGWQPVSLQGFDSLGCGSIAYPDSIYAQYQVPAILSVMQDPCTRFVDIFLGSSTDSCAFFIGDSLITTDCAGYIRYDMRRYQEYTYTLYATQPNGCNDTTSLVVDVRTEPVLFLANAFTPNEDGVNDLWPDRVDISDYGFELRVFDRWGAELWATKNPLDQWDGVSGGKELPLGVYPYTMRMRDPCEPTNEVTTKGHVTILR